MNPAYIQEANKDYDSLNKALSEALPSVKDLIYHVLEGEWDYVYKELLDGAEPNETRLWLALLCNHQLFGGSHPSTAFKKGMRGLDVTLEGKITNRKAYFEL